MKVALYARVSTEEQAEKYSLNAQLEAMRQYAKEQGWEVVEEYIDPGYSGRSDKRPAFRRLIRDALAGKFEAILVHALDRFARSRFVSVTYKALLKEQGIFIYSVTEHIDHNDVNSVVMEGMLEVMAEWYSANLSVKVKAGMKRAVAEGQWPFRAPFGYEKKRDLTHSWLEVAEVGAKITYAFQEFSTGKYTLASWTEVAWDLGYRNAKGGKIHKSQWGAIFRNTFYIGLVTYDGEEYRGSWPPLIDPATFQRVQEILDDHRPIGRGPYTPHRDYLLTGLLWSLDSDSSMHGTIAKHKLCYYRSMEICENGKRHHVRCEILEQAVSELLYDVVIDNPQVIKLFDPPLQLALKAASSVGHVYNWLETFDQKREILCTVFERLYVKGQEITAVTLKPDFRLVEGSRFRNSLVGLPGFEPGTNRL